MKTPREILLGRHADANGRLDRMRKQVLTGAFPEPSKPGRNPDSDRTALSLLWHTLFAPGRIAWTGLAAAWVVVLALHCAARSDDTTVVRHESPPSPQVIATLKEQRQMLAELVGFNWQAGPAQPRRFEPKPRSEASGTFNIV